MHIHWLCLESDFNLKEQRKSRDHMQISMSKNEQGNIRMILRLGMLKVQYREIFYMAKSFRDRDKLREQTALK